MLVLFTLTAIFGLYGVVQCAALYNVTATATTTDTATATATGSPLTTRNAKFVQKLKEDLRRNNDDYILGRKLMEPEPETAVVVAGAAAGGDSAEQSSGYIDDVEEVYRRALLERGTQHLKIRSKYRKRPLALHRPPGADAGNVRNDTEAGNVLPLKDDAGAGGLHHFRAMDLAREKSYTPSPDQLDMAPARGRKITIIRNKGRLCQRHVLIPEGPKYDSEGRVYLRAHPPHAARPYSRTRAPRILLPRCCNCCKKSVLGCE